MKVVKVNDPVGGYCPWPGSPRAGEANGPLADMTFAVKDLIDVAGLVTGGGNPDWRAGQKPAPADAPAVARLLAAGANFQAKTITDELAFSLDGRNEHYGTPFNAAAPDRLPGGSSSGSAAVVAGALVDFALGTDTGGSVRVPASFCGIFGIRPTHGAISLDGVIPFAPGFDTLGWFARDGASLLAVGKVLLAGAANARLPQRIALCEDAFALCDANAREPLLNAASQVTLGYRDNLMPGVRVSEEGLLNWAGAYQVIQAAEIRRSLGPWIMRTRPLFGANIAPRFASIEEITVEQVRAATALRSKVRAHLDTLLADAVLLLPTVPIAAPPRNIPEEQLGALYPRLLALASISSLCGLPQVTLPLAQHDGCPLGLSFIGPRGSDLALLQLAASIKVPPPS